jgi:hypothetical protein
MLGAVALMAATAVVALANYATGLTLTGKCFDTYTSGTLVTQDAQTATPPHSVTLEILASQNGGSTYPYFVANTTIDLKSGQNSYPWSIYTSNAAYLATPYDAWEVTVESTSGVTNQISAPVMSTTLCSPDPNTPESPLAVALPLAGLAIFAGAFGVVIRRRRRSASAV